MDVINDYGKSDIKAVADAAGFIGNNPEISIQDVLELENANGSFFTWVWQRDTGRIHFNTPRSPEQAVIQEALADAISALVDRIGLAVSSSGIEELHLNGLGASPRCFVIRWGKADGAGSIGPSRILGTAREITSQKACQQEMESKLSFIDALMDSLACPVFFKDENLVYQHCNKAFEAYMGLTRESILNKSVYDLSPPELAEVYHASDVKLLESQIPQIYEAGVQTAGGVLMDVMFHKSVVFNKQGELKGIVGIIYDITDRVKAEKLLNRAMQVKDAIVEISHSIMSVDTIEELYVSILNRIVSAMPMADSGCFLMYTSPDVLSVVAGNGIFAKENNPIIVPAESCLGCHAMNGDPNHCFTVNNIKDYAQEKGFVLNGVLNSEDILSMLYAPITSKGRLSGFLAVGSKMDNAFDASDVSIMDYVRVQLVQVLEKQHLYEKNTYLAKHDGLTGLLNRKQFEELFETSKNHAQIYHESFHLILIDLDRFKSINDNCGHHVGDAVLMDFSRKLRQCFRESDIVARFGGDEFIVLLKNTTAADLELRLESFRARLMESIFESSDCAFSYGFSYGICEFPLEGVELERLIKLVDYNLYVYKKFKDDYHTEEPVALNQG